MRFDRVLLRTLIEETRDGDWGPQHEAPGSVPCRVIRGGDFPDVENGAVSGVPLCYLKPSSIARRTLQPNDIVIETAGGARERPTGRVLLISADLLEEFEYPATCASFARFIRIDSRKVNPKYVFWYLRWMYNAGMMWEHQVQHTGVARFQFTKFADTVEIALPSREHQDSAVDILDSLHHSLLQNRRFNKTLEDIAQTIFRAWFVDFLPVRAKMVARSEGRDVVRAAMCVLSSKAEDELDEMPKERYEKLAELAQLFPEALDDSEIGKIPRTWQVEALQTVTASLARGISPKYTDKAGILVINQRCIRDNVLDLSKARRHDSNVRGIRGRELCVGDVLVNSTGVGTLGRVAQVFHLDEPTIVDSHVTVVRSGPSITWNFLGLELARRQSEIEQLGEGSTGQTELNRSKLAGLLTIVPPCEVLGHFDALTTPLRERISLGLRQNETLSELRDSVLPKLISGEIPLRHPI
jgi:type I restriction enzyme S subunit